MDGFFDLLALLLRWKSARILPSPPYHVAGGRVWHTGAEAGGQHLAGPATAQVFITGQTAGQTHG